MGSAPNSKYDYLIKLLLIGDSGVGKSCLLLRYSDSSFTTSFITTIGIDFKIKPLRIGGENHPVIKHEKRCKLQIWDTAGQERFRTITTAYYRGAMGILLVYDVTDRTSYNNVKNWIRQIEQHASENVDLILLANKCDVDDDTRVVSKEEGEALAEEYNIPFLETSAKNNLNVDEGFQKIAEEIVKRLEKEKDTHNEEGKGQTLKLGKGEEKKNGCC